MPPTPPLPPPHHWTWLLCPLHRVADRVGDRGCKRAATHPFPRKRHFYPKLGVFQDEKGLVLPGQWEKRCLGCFCISPPAPLCLTPASLAPILLPTSTKHSPRPPRPQPGLCPCWSLNLENPSPQPSGLSLAEEALPATCDHTVQGDPLHCHSPMPLPICCLVLACNCTVICSLTSSFSLSFSSVPRPLEAVSLCTLHNSIQ